MHNENSKMEKMLSNCMQFITNTYEESLRETTRLVLDQIYGHSKFERP